MKYILTASAFLLTTTAYSADMVYEVVPVPVVEPAPQWNWTGAYFGINAGYGGGTFKHPFDLSVNEGEIGPAQTFSLLNGSLDFTAGGFVGGIQAGYNWQHDNIIYGFETDFQASGIKGSGKFSFYDNLDETGLSGEIGTKLDWFGTIRARLGTPVNDRMMIYATGGAAYGRTKSFAKGTETYYDGYFDEDDNFIEDEFTTTDTFDISKKLNKWGWTIGAGVEYAVTQNISFKTEYLYTDLGKANLVSLGEYPTFNLDRKVSFHTVRAGLNYRF